jgi:hypothetical protein
MGHGKSLGSFDGPPIFLYVHGLGHQQKPMSTSKNRYGMLIIINIIANRILKSNIIQIYYGLYTARRAAGATAPPPGENI